MTTTYWPPEGTPNFVSHDDEETWTPLCCGAEMRYVPSIGFTHQCTGECGSRWIIWADEWPDYDDDDDD